MENVNKGKFLENKLTILVSSCDAYQDLWHPFFTLLKKYWALNNVKIILNTESVDYKFNGLNINCVHPENPKVPYGERMLNALASVKTEYVLMLLDDFFLREKVDMGKIKKIIEWLDNDNDIACFNCDLTPVYADWEPDKYPGYRRIPWGNEYTLNMQAAIWRTDKLKKYWRNNVSPWDWEEYCNLYGAINKKDKFYCACSTNSGFCNYGFRSDRGWAVVQGKLVLDDLKPLFKKENIKFDFSKRGEFYTKIEENNYMTIKLRDSLIKRSPKSDVINRCIPKFKCQYRRFVKKNNFLQGVSLYCSTEDIFVKYILLKYRKKWYKKQERLHFINTIKKHGIVNIVKEHMKKLIENKNVRK